MTAVRSTAAMHVGGERDARASVALGLVIAAARRGGATTEIIRLRIVAVAA
jgi:hypothetical protein